MKTRVPGSLVILPVLFILACSDAPPTPNLDTENVGVLRVDPAIVAEADIDTPPERLSSPPLEYPRALHDAGTEGNVFLTAVIGIDGTVEDGSIEVLSATHDEFARAASRLLAKSKFTPGMHEGQEVRVRIELPVTFRLQPTR